MFTRASLVAAINSILGGAGLAVLAAWVAALEDGAALTVGAVLALVLFVCTCCINSAAASMSGFGVSWPDRKRVTGRRGLRSSGAEAELAVPVLR